MLAPYDINLRGTLLYVTHEEKISTTLVRRFTARVAAKMDPPIKTSVEGPKTHVYANGTLSFDLTYGDDHLQLPPGKAEYQRGAFFSAHQRTPLLAAGEILPAFVNELSDENRLRKDLSTIVDHAHAEAKGMNHMYTGSEHLLLAAFRLFPEDVLQPDTCEEERLRAYIERHAGQGPPTKTLSPAARKMLLNSLDLYEANFPCTSTTSDRLALLRSAIHSLGQGVAYDYLFAE